MSTIIELPDEPKYTIKIVASQTGIRPVTLRAWERRHEILTPHRDCNRYRLYSERDVAVLCWLKNRVEEGMSISSAVSELRRMAGSNLWPEAILPSPGPQPHRHKRPPARYAQQLLQSLILHDEKRAGGILREARATFGLVSVCEDILVPVLRELGEAWHRGEIRITTEHFASAYLRGKLLSLLQTYSSRRSAPLILIGCAPAEQHELGSLMLAVLLRSTGYRVEYLGPDIPVEDLADYAGHESPAMVILSATRETTARELRRMQEMLNKTRSNPVFGYGGRAFDLQPALCQEIPGVYLGSTLEAALSTARGLLKNRSKTGASLYT